MNKMIFFALIIIMALAVGTVFAGGEQESGSEEQDSISLTVGMQDQPGSIPYIGMETFKSKLESASGNTIEVELFPSSQLGDYKAMAGQVSAGELDIVLTGYPDMSFMVPAFEVIGEPYVVTSYEQLQNVISGDFAQALHQELETGKNIKFLDLWYTGARQVTSNRPLNSIDDFKGLKLRTPNVPFLIHFAKAAGAVPTPIAFQEVYLALQTNQVEAEENPLVTIDVMKFYEVQEYIAMTSHFVATTGIWINTDTWSALSKPRQDKIMDALAAARKVNNDMAFENESKLVDQFKERGIKFTYPDIVPFQEAMAPFYEELNKKHASYGNNIIQKIQNIK